MGLSRRWLFSNWICFPSSDSGIKDELIIDLFNSKAEYVALSHGGHKGLCLRHFLEYEEKTAPFTSGQESTSIRFSTGGSHEQIPLLKCTRCSFSGNMGLRGGNFPRKKSPKKFDESLKVSVQLRISFTLHLHI